MSNYKVLLTIPSLALILTAVVGCNNGIYSNPASPPASPTEWRSMVVDSAGGTFVFDDIGASLVFPPESLPPDELPATFQIRLFPEGIPLLPTGPVYVRLSSFQLVGPDVEFQERVEVRCRLAEPRKGGVGMKGYVLNERNEWEFFQNVPVLSDGMRALVRIDKPGVYGVFEPVPLHVEARISRQQGPAPLSVAFEAIITGGHPPYDVIWDFGDNEDPGAGVAVAHIYKDPGVYNPVVTVIDSDRNTATDRLTLIAYALPGPPNAP